MTSSFLGGATITSRAPATPPSRKVAVACAAREEAQVGKVQAKSNESGRRDLVFAAAAAALCAAAGVAVAEEPKRGTAEARKAYAPICVTMPTARICRK